MMDILIVHGQKSHVTAIYNNFGKSAFFLKVRFISDETIGNTLHTVSYRCVLTDLDDQKFIVTAVQSGQTAYNALQLPFSQIGIGRSNNFIESLYVSVPVNGQRIKRVWTPIIPKSVLFITGTGMEEPENWQIDVLVKPNEKMAYIIFVDLFFLIVLGLIIIVLHLKEKVS